MTRAEIIEALQRHAKGEGPAVTVIAQGRQRPCRYHANNGPQWLNLLDMWQDDDIDSVETYALKERRQSCSYCGCGLTPLNRPGGCDSCTRKIHDEDTRFAKSLQGRVRTGACRDIGLPGSGAADALEALKRHGYNDGVDP